jgi:thiol-disulfide isomerase/thioredoxin
MKYVILLKNLRKKVMMFKSYSTTILILFATSSFGAKIEFISSVSLAKKLAKKENKIIFVDVMADWCAPCKAMINDMEQDDEVVTFFNENFINLKINEKYERQFLTTYNITSLPTILYLDEEANVIESFNGYRGVSYIYSNATRINESKAIIRQLSIKPEETEFDEYLFIDMVSEVISTMPKTNIKFALHELIKKGMPFSKPILHNFPNHIDPDVFTKTYIELDGKKDQLLTEKLIICQMLTDDAFQSTTEFKLKSKPLVELTGMESNKIISYALAFREFNMYQHLGLVSEQSKLVNAKNLLNHYPETADIELLLQAFSEVVKTIRKEDLPYFQKLENTFTNITKSTEQYIHLDILSVIHYALGNKDAYITAIAKANDLARKQGIKHVPLLKELRIYLD